MNKTIVLRAKKVRNYIIDHPGCTKDEIYAAHPGEKLTGSFELLEKHGMIKHQGDRRTGGAKWFPTQAKGGDKNMRPIPLPEEQE